MLVLCAFLPFITFDNVRSSFTKRQAMFPVVLALCFILKIFDLPNITLKSYLRLYTRDFTHSVDCWALHT